MGLDVSHNAFSGSYGRFNSFRQTVCHAIGGSYPPHYERNDDNSFRMGSDNLPIRNLELDDEYFYYNDDGKYNERTAPGLHAFLAHSDCDGEISPDICLKIADELEAILPAIEKIDTTIGHRFSYVRMTMDFIAGCRLAASNNEPLEFM